LKNQGVKFILLDCQINFIAPLTELFRTKKYPYVEIQQNESLIVKLEDSRNFLSSIGFEGEIIHTPGHSDDSVTLILDEGYAFTGDLHPSFMNTDDEKTRASWQSIRQHKITRIFPGHGS
jgi:glyoxylase-like metal-dependent hydrolase (beta-lactamase superfamily II)